MTCTCCTPEPVTLVLTDEVVAHICANCLEPCTEGGQHIRPRIKTEKVDRL